MTNGEIYSDIFISRYREREGRSKEITEIRYLTVTYKQVYDFYVTVLEDIEKAKYSDLCISSISFFLG
jgi:hypothetical protein